jgi:hypothetical protein
VQTCSSPNNCTNVPPPRNGTFYVYGLEDELLGEYDLANGGQAVREYIWLQGMPVAVVVNDSSNPAPSISQMFYIHADHLNTPRVVVNRVGSRRWSWTGWPSPLAATAKATTRRAAGGAVGGVARLRANREAVLLAVGLRARRPPRLAR